jgi:hypothetical protein
LARISEEQQAEKEREFYYRTRLHVIGTMPTRAMLNDGSMPLGAGDVLPSFTQPRQDKYRHVSFHEQNNPILAEEAWRIHTDGYHSHGFVSDEALDPVTGVLGEDIDKSRGRFVEYHIAFNPKKPADRATLRIDGLAPGGTYKDLPAYQLCKDTLSPEGAKLLDSITHQDRRVKEIAAMATSAQGHPMGVYEIIRKVIQDEIGKDEVWMFSIVSTTFQSLVQNFGSDNFNVIGEDASIADDRVNSELRLRPTVLYPDKFIDNILGSFNKLGNEPKEARDKLRLARSLLFITEGLHPGQMSEDVRAMRSTLLEKAHHKPQA